MTVLKIYVVGIVLYFLIIGVKQSMEELSKTDFLITVLLNIWLYPIMWYEKLEEKIFVYRVKRKVMKDFGLKSERDTINVKDINKLYDINFMKDLHDMDRNQLKKILQYQGYDKD